MPFAKIEGRQLHYTDYASSSNSPTALAIVLVHGLGSTQNYYGPILPYLTDYRCITFDNYGAGRSKYLSDMHPDTSIEQIADDVLGLMDYLKVDKAVVVGYSMGGMVPTTIAASKKGAGRIISAICIGPVHPSPQVAEVFVQRVKTVTEGESPIYLSSGVAGKRPSIVGPSAVLINPIGGIETMANTIPNAATGPSTTQLQKSFIREMIMSQDPEGYCANCKAIEAAKSPKYDAVQCPIYIIAGEVDKSAPVSGCQFIHDSLTGVSDKKMDVVKGMGHWYCVEDPDDIGKKIAGWCSKFA